MLFRRIEATLRACWFVSLPTWTCLGGCIQCTWVHFESPHLESGHYAYHVSGCGTSGAGYIYLGYITSRSAVQLLVACLVCISRPVLFIVLLLELCVVVSLRYVYLLVWVMCGA